MRGNAPEDFFYPGLLACVCHREDVTEAVLLSDVEAVTLGEGLCPPVVVPGKDRAATSDELRALQHPLQIRGALLLGLLLDGSAAGEVIPDGRAVLDVHVMVAPLHMEKAFLPFEAG